MRGKNGTRPRGLSISSENMCFFTDDPLMQGVACYGNGGLLLSHTPPNFTPGSYEVSHMKRARAGSISGRLRSASDLEEKGLIDKSQKGVLKDLIISGDSELQAALDSYDRGDVSQLEALMEAGLLDRRDSLDLLQDLDFGIMDLGTSAEQRECNDIMDIIGRKDSGGGDEGQGGGVSGGSSGDGAAAAGTGSNGGGGNAEASAPEGEGVGSFGADVDGVLLDCTAWALGDDGSIALGDGVAHKRVHRSDGESAAGGNNDCGNNSACGAVSQNVAEAGAAAAGGVTSASRRGPNATVGAGSGAGAGGNGDSDREIDLGAEGASADQFDIGDMAFDTTFEHDFDEDEVDIKQGAEAEDPGAHAALGTRVAVGPLAVGGGSSQLSSAHHDGVHNEGNQAPGEGDPGVIGDESRRGRGRRHGGGAVAGVAGVAGAGVEELGVEGHDEHHDDDEPCLGSFGMLGVPTAPIGDFSPQFKFSFTEDSHLDLGSGLKDELRDLESLSEPLSGQNGGKGGESFVPIMNMGIYSSSRPQLLSRGGPSVKSEALCSMPPEAGTTSSGGTAGLNPATSTRGVSSAVTDDFGAGLIDRARDSHTGGEGANVDGDFEYERRRRPAASTGRRKEDYATSRATSSGSERRDGVGGERAEESREMNSSSATTSYSGPARGRPVMSGMGIMVTGVHSSRSGTGPDEERKFVGAYSPEARRQRIQRFLEKREHRVWTKMVKYDVRKNFADTRMRVKGRFVKKEDEALLRELMACA